MQIKKMVKAIAVTAAFWGVAWSLLSIPTLVFLLRTVWPARTSPTSLVLSWAADAWFYAFSRGVVLGVVFSVLLIVASRRGRWFRTLSYPGLGLLGALTAGVVGAVIAPGMGAAQLLVGATLGATTAIVTLGVARRAPADNALDPIADSPRIATT